MSGVSLPVTRPLGRALLVGTPSARTAPGAILARLGCACVEIDDPYAAMVELSAQPQNYASLILSMSSLFGEELEMISVVKRRYPQIEIWLTRAEGLDSTFDQAMRLGADGILTDDGPHRLPKPAAATPAATPSASTRVDVSDEHPLNEPVLSAEELRALLDDPPPNCMA
jgi:hypothetical protein